MIKKAVNSDGAPSAVGPYSHSVLAGDTLYVSGQLGLDPATGKLADGVAAQAKQGLTNLGAILKTSGLDYKDVVKTTVFLKDINDFATINKIYGEYFTELLPARSCIEVANLPAGGLFEIEAVAIKD
ncbi:RidA family protein [Agrilactobacillus yilanensis]|uniref:RidA family protein n=1 Tax=Agrilactobacillus yilanensis TaxID=2485997 RepID=A0ABW4J5B8_9LACO|nr:RidA family protein [Agrilactobacillus yilanensis]